MIKNKLTTILAFLVLSIILAACSMALPKATLQPGVDETAVYGTVVSELTRIAFQTLVGQLTEVSKDNTTPTPQVQPTKQQPSQTTQPGDPTATPISPSSTATPKSPSSTASPIPPTPTNTVIPPTNTRVPATLTATVIPCNWSLLVKDVSVPDGSVYYGGDVFRKIWRLKNIGTCTWNEDYSIVFSSGDQMDGADGKKLGATVKPGATIDISLKFVAPNKTDEYVGLWALSTDKGKVFGIGANAGSAFWVKVNVTKTRPGWSTSDPLSFALNYKAAVWMNTSSVLPAPGLANDFMNGSITYTAKPNIESPKDGGKYENEATLIMIPSSGDNGIITGTYPELEIKAGDHFVAILGCMWDSKNCTATIKLSYIIGTADAVELGSWTEKYDGKWTTVNIDLNALAGKKVKFVLTVISKGNNTNDRIFWLNPHIKR